MYIATVLLGVDPSIASACRDTIRPVNSEELDNSDVDIPDAARVLINPRRFLFISF